MHTSKQNVLTMSTSGSVNSTSALDLSSHPYFLSQIILSVMFATPAVLFNVVLLISIYRDPGRNQLNQSPVTFLVVNLSVCDLLIGVVPGFGSLYYDIALFKRRGREELAGARILLTFVGVVANVVSSCTIAAMSLDRFFAVSSPLQYKARVTKAKVKAFIAICWVYALLFSCLSLGVSITVFVLLYCHLHVSLPLIILPVVYWKTYSAFRSHNNRVGNLADGRQAMDIVHRNRERKMISAFLLVLVLFYVTFMPQFIAQNMLVVQPSYLQAESFLFFLYTSNKFVLVNSSLNPFVYAWRIPKYRRAFKEVFRGCGARNRSTNTEAGGRAMTMMTVHRTEPASMDNNQPIVMST